MTNPNVTNEQAQRDRNACIYEADLATAAIQDTVMRLVRRNDLVVTCLRGRGYT